jgi:hypothetical protein
MRKVSYWITILFVLVACGDGSTTPYLVTLTPVATFPSAPTITPQVTVTDRATEPSSTSTGVVTTPLQATFTSEPSVVTDTDTPPPPPPTDTPLPPTPTVDPWPAARGSLAASKMGIHVILNDDPRIMEWIRRTKPRVVKGLDNLDWLAQVKQESPQTVTIGRYTENNITSILDNLDPSQFPNPADTARNFIDQHIAQYRANPGVDYWEGWNEPQWHTQAQWEWYGEFEASRACFMNDLGLKAAVGGFSAGRPEYVEMGYFIPGLRKAAACNAIFTLHEYSSPTMQFGFNAGIPNAVHVDNAGSLTMRYRYWYEGYIKPAGFIIPLVISEAGIDNGVGQGCPLKDGGQGWFACYKDWDALNLGPEKWRIYLDQLTWYDNLLRQDDYVIGFTIFTAGTSNVETWRTFDINDLLIPMAVYMNGQ